MDRFVRKLSMRVAQNSTRRDFMSTMVRGAVGLGLGAGILFGGRAFADVVITSPCGGNNLSSYNGNSHCTGLGCSIGDSNGCTGFGTDNSHPGYCRDCNGNKGCSNVTGGNTQVWGHWTCCCNNQKSQCVDCSTKGGASATCICKVDPGETC